VRRGPFTVLATLLAGGMVIATPAAQQQVFRGGTDVVLLNVSAVDGRNRPVPGLAREDFQVFEDGIPQDIAIFTREAQPIALSLLLDTSTSMEPRMSVAQEAASGFIGKLQPRDIAQVISFDSRVLIAEPFTPDRGALDRAIRKTEAGGQTSLYDAVYIALDSLNRAPKPSVDAVRRQVIVLLSDGEDTASHKDYDEVMALSRRSDVIVFAIGVKTNAEPVKPGWNEAEFVLRTLAQETGGRVFPLTDFSTLASIYAQITDDLASQYTLGYRSKNLRRDGGWRRVVVQVPQGGVTARTKSGYFAPAKAR
jgi:Ca-activated chloride channel family protein